MNRMFGLLRGRLTAFLVFSFLLLCSARLPAQQVIINEVYNSSLSTDEWIECLVVGDNVDIRGWSIQDFSSGGSPAGTLTFSSAGLWSAVPKGRGVQTAFFCSLKKRFDRWMNSVK